MKMYDERPAQDIAEEREQQLYSMIDDLKTQLAAARSAPKPGVGIDEAFDRLKAAFYYHFKGAWTDSATKAELSRILSAAGGDAVPEGRK